jgi:hypothetical protein
MNDTFNAPGEGHIASDMMGAVGQKQKGRSTDNSDHEQQRLDNAPKPSSTGNEAFEWFAEASKAASRAGTLPDLDPTEVDGEGWPLLHRAVTAAATAGPGKSNSTKCASGSSSTAPGGSSGGSTTLPTLQQVLEACTDINLKGPGGFTALHMACLGPLDAQQRK